MRKVLYVLLLVALLFVPLNRVNVADLLPVEAVAVYMDGDWVVLETDTEHTGRGTTVKEALADLKENTPAVVYLDTAEYLLVSADAAEQIDSLRPYLKSSVKVCMCMAPGRVKDVVEYLEIHGDLPRLKNLKQKMTKSENNT